MIFGYAKIEDGAVVTHRDSYRLSDLSVFSVRRPLLAPSVIWAAGFAAFTWSFADILYVGEIAMILCAVSGQLIMGFTLGQLKLLSNALRGSELSGAVWGTYAHLNLVRADITRELRSARKETSDGAA
jgi:hypothetical protein